ncbi:MAG TPA: WbuC family cupin fold metalloprotein [Burkholderiales bacterium]|nr:WbuC family cupin fold metalloprotein [Burkholderiales bacterium]
MTNNHLDNIIYKRANSIKDIKIITQANINDTLIDAVALERKREPILIHDNFEEIPQRFVNCLNENSYIRPHMHIIPKQWELMSWLSGEIIAFIFDVDGNSIQKIIMNEDNVKVIEIPPFCYHTFVAVTKGSYLEIRNCKYNPSVDRVYSSWSPLENSSLAENYQKKFFTAKVGDKLVI